MVRPAWWHRLRRRVGRRGSALLFFGVLDLVYAWGLAWPDPQSRATPSLMFVNTVLPLAAWAVLWGFVGLACVYHAFHRYDAFGFRCAIGIKMIWGGVSFIGWALAGVPRGYVTAAIWYGLAGLVWIIAGWREPEPHGDDAS